MTRTEAVERVLLAAQDAPFAWGTGPEGDCGGPIEAYLESVQRLPWDVLERSDERAARRALKRLGARTPAGLLDLHFESIAPLLARTGDLAAAVGDGPGKVACGIVSGGDVYVRDEIGMKAVPLTHAIRAWSVPGG